MIKLVKGFLFGIIFLIVCLNTAWCTTYYLCPATETCDETATYNTFSDLQSNVTFIPGDIIDGQGQTYTGTWTINQSGTSAGDITIQNVVINAQGNDFGVFFNTTDFITLKNVTVQNPNLTGILVGAYWSDLEGSDNITIDDCIVENSLMRGILVGSGSDNVIINNTDIINPAERGVYIWAQGADINSITITNNRITKSIASIQDSQHGIHLYAEGYSATTKISDIFIDGNIVQLGDPLTNEKYGDIGIWIQANGAKSAIVNGAQVPLIYFYDMIMTNNKVSYGQSGGVVIGSLSIENFEHNLIQWNEVYNNGKSDDLELPSHSLGIETSDNIIIANNKFHDNLSNALDGVGIFLDQLSSWLTVRQNIIYGHNAVIDNEPYGTNGQFNSSGIGICCGANNNVIYENISYGNTVGISIGQASIIDDMGIIHHVYNNKIYNNVIAANEIGILNKAGYMPQWLTNSGGIESIPENCNASNNFCNEIKNNIIFNNKGNNGRQGAGLWTRTGAINLLDTDNVFIINDESLWINGATRLND